jgi:hypothetical protein
VEVGEFVACERADGGVKSGNRLVAGLHKWFAEHVHESAAVGTAFHHWSVPCGATGAGVAKRIAEEQKRMMAAR